MKSAKRLSSKKKKISNTFSFSSLLTTYWFHLTIITVIAFYTINRTFELRQFAQSCMTRAMVTSDSRCLYIYQNHVYQKGTRNSPHKGNLCGTDVTTIIPSFHFMSAAVYLDPNLVGTLCSETVTTPTPVPTVRPTSTPAPSVRPSVTPVPTTRPTNTPIPTSTIRPSSTPLPTNRPTTTIQPTLTITPTISPTSTPIATPTQATLPPISAYPSWWNMIPEGLKNYLVQLYYWVFYFMRPADNAQVLEGVFPTPTP